MTTKKSKAFHPPTGAQVEIEDDPSEPSDLAIETLDTAVVYNTDWTVETIALQTANIATTPAFQRRDAWPLDKKSRFIESLVLGLPIPPLVLAEQKEKGSFLVLDGKQRLLSIWQYWGLQPESPNNNFKLSGLEIIHKATGHTKSTLEADPTTKKLFVALKNQPIRTVVIRNWPSEEFLHLVFLRLNTGSTKLSPQELRQALRPGSYTTEIDKFAAASASLRKLLQNDGPDSRMQDTEIAARHLAFVNFHTNYPNRMKKFIDDSYESLNASWAAKETEIRSQMSNLEDAIEALINVFGGVESFARKPNSRMLNKALLDPLLFFFAVEQVRDAAKKHKDTVKKNYEKTLADEGLLRAIGLDTASTASVKARFDIIATALAKATKVPIKKPQFG